MRRPLRLRILIAVGGFAIADQLVQHLLLADGYLAGVRVAPFDPLTLVAVVGVMTIVAAAAALLPARRAARVNPIEALR